MKMALNWPYPSNVCSPLFHGKIFFFAKFTKGDKPFCGFVPFVYPSLKHSRPPLLSEIHLYALSGDISSERQIVFYENHGGRKFPDKTFNLHATIDVDIIERLIPHIQMGLLAQVFCYQHLFLLSRRFCPAEKSSIFFSNCMREKSIFRKMALNRLSSIWQLSANSDKEPRSMEVSWGT